MVSEVKENRIVAREEVEDDIFYNLKIIMFQDPGCCRKGPETGLPRYGPWIILSKRLPNQICGNPPSILFIFNVLWFT
jgi:hypothetical protein